NIVRFVWVLWNDIQECFVASVARITARTAWWRIDVIGWHIAKQFAYPLQAPQFGVARKMGDTAGAGVGVGSAQLFHSHIFMRDGLHDIWSGNEHVARSSDHVNEI